MLPMDNGNPLMPAMMGIIAGQQAMQRSAQEEQTVALEAQNRLIAEQNMLIMWQDPNHRARFVDWFINEATDYDRAKWIWNMAMNVSDDTFNYITGILLDSIPEDLDLTGMNNLVQQWWHDLHTNTDNKPRRKGWFRK